VNIFQRYVHCIIKNTKVCWRNSTFNNQRKQSTQLNLKLYMKICCFFQTC